MKKPGFESLEKGDFIYKIDYPQLKIDRLCVESCTFIDKETHYDGHYTNEENNKVCRYNISAFYEPKKFPPELDYYNKESFTYDYKDDNRCIFGYYFIYYDEAVQFIFNRINDQITKNEKDITELEYENIKLKKYLDEFGKESEYSLC